MLQTTNTGPKSSSNWLDRINHDTKKQETVSHLEKKLLTENQLLNIGRAALTALAAGSSEKIDRLWRYIFRTREIGQKGEIAATNALTALNLAGYSFAGKDFRGVRTFKANLSKGIFYKTNFTDAVLKGANLEDAYLENAVLTNANLEGVNFGFYSLGKTTHPFCLDVFKDKIIVGENGKSFDGKKFKNIYLYSLSTKDEIWHADHTCSVISTKFSFDGSKVISCGSDGIIYIRNAEDGSILVSLNSCYIQKRILEEKLSQQVIAKLQQANCIYPVTDFPDFFEVTSDLEKFRLAQLENLEEIASLLDQNVAIYGLDVSQSVNSIIAWTNANGDIFVWDLEKRKLESVITGDSAKRISQFFGNTNDLLMMTDDMIRMIDPKTSKVLKKWTSPNPVYSRLTHCAITQKIAAVGFEGVVIWDLNSGEQPVKILEQFIPDSKNFSGIILIRSIAFSTDGRQLAIGGDNNIVIWDTNNWSIVRNIWWDKIKSPITELRFSEKNDALIAICEGLPPRVWKLGNSNSSAEHLPVTNYGSIKSLTLDHENKFLFTLSDTILQCWNGETGQRIFQIGGVKSYVLSKDSQYLLTEHPHVKVGIWDIHSQKEIKVIEGDFNEIKYISATTIILMGEAKAQVYDILNEYSYEINLEKLKKCVMSPNNQYLLVASNRVVALWDIDSCERLKRFDTKTDVLGIGFLSDEKAMFFTEEGAQTFNPEPLSDRVYNVLKGKTSLVTAFVFSDKGQLAFGKEDGSISLWDSKTGTMHKVTKSLPESKITSIKFSEDVVISTSETSVHFWFPQKGFGHNFKNCEEGWIITHDPICLLLKNKNNQFYFFKCFNNKFIQDYQISTKSDPPLSSDDLYPYIDDFGRPKRYSEDQHRFYESNHSVSAMAFHPLMTHLALGCENGMIQIWNTHNGKLVNVLQGHSSAVSKLSFSHDGFDLYSVSQNSSMQKYEFLCGYKQASFCWRTEPYGLVLNGINSYNAILDDEGETLLFDQNAKTDQVLALRPLRGTLSELARAYVFPPDNSDYFTDIEIKTINIENAIILIDNQILKNDDDQKFLEAIGNKYNILKKLIPSEFHFFLKAIHVCAQDLQKRGQFLDPFEAYFLLYMTKLPQPLIFITIRELLDKKFRLIMQRILGLSEKVRCFVDISEVLYTVGDTFKKENIDILAAICYSDSLQQKPNGNVQILLEELLENPIISEAYKEFFQLE